MVLKFYTRKGICQYLNNRKQAQNYQFINLFNNIMSKINLLIIGIIVLVGGAFIGYYGLGSNGSTSGALKASKNYRITAQADGMALWQFPDKRALDPALFGTPQNPLLTNLFPLKMRDVNNAGTAYTTTSKPVPFSNKTKETTGSINISIEDLTALDGPNSKDKATMEANFKGPKGEDFKVVLKKLISKGGDHQMFGGVGTNVLMHGATGIGTPLVAQEFSYSTLSGAGDLYKDGKLIDSGRVIHMMVSERTRDSNFKIGFGVAKPKELEIHLMLPPKKGTAMGPVENSVPTGVILPNGVEQPFIHTNFYGNIKMTGDQFIG